MEFKEILKDLRTSKNLTQEQLAKAINYSTITISKWETGVKNPSIESIKILAKFFDVTTDYLLDMDR